VGDELTRLFRDARRFPSNTIVARTEGYTYDAKVWDLSLVQGPFSVAPCQTLIVTIRNLFTAVSEGAHHGVAQEHARLPLHCRVQRHHCHHLRGVGARSLKNRMSRSPNTSRGVR
jgi:hypothetical protein